MFRNDSTKYDKVRHLYYNLTINARKQASVDLLGDFCKVNLDTPTPIAVFDRDLKFVWMNRKSEELLPAIFRGSAFTLFQKKQILDAMKNAGAVWMDGDVLAVSSDQVFFTKMGDYIVSAIVPPATARSERGGIALDSIDRFTGIVRTAMDTITLSAKSIERTLDGDNLMQDSFDNIRRSCYAVLRNTQNITLVSRYRAGQLGITKRTCNVNELISAVCLAVQSVCNNDIPIRLTLPAEAVVTELDARLCERALLNVLLNAMSYTRDGNEITMTLSQSAGQIFFTIKDRGAGILKENLPDVAELYFSREPASDSEISPGMGAGLPVAAIFCQTHGGSMVIDSEFGEGTTVALSVKKEEPGGEAVLKASVAQYVTDAFSPVYIEMSGICEIPH